MLKEVINDGEDMRGISNNSFSRFFDTSITQKSYTKRIPLGIKTRLILEPGFDDIRYDAKGKTKYLVDIRVLQQKNVFNGGMNIR